MSNRSQNKNRNNLFAQCTKFTSVWWPLTLEHIDRFTDRCLGPDHSIKSQGDVLPASNKGRYWSRNLQACVCWLAKCHNPLCCLCSEAMYLWVRRVEGEKAVGLQRFYVVLGFFTTRLIMPRKEPFIQDLWLQRNGDTIKHSLYSICEPFIRKRNLVILSDAKGGIWRIFSLVSQLWFNCLGNEYLEEMDAFPSRIWPTKDAPQLWNQ